MAKRGLCLLLALAAVFSLAAPVLAEEAPVPAEDPAVTEEPVAAAEVVETEEEPVIEPEEVTEEPEAEPEVTEEAVEEPVEEPEAEPETVASSGTCGDGVTWTLTDDGVLTISGSGGINGDAFKRRGDIKTVVIENGVTSVGESAFYDCTGLTSVSIPNSVTSVGAQAFHDCPAIENIFINANLPDVYNNDSTYYSLLGYSKADNAVSLHVTFGDNVTSIPASLFRNCGRAASVTFGKNVGAIGERAFAGCARLTSVTLPESVKSVGNGAFYDCMSLSKVVINSDLADCTGGPFSIFVDNGDTGVPLQATFGDKVTRIPAYIFSSCETLTSVTIPNGVTSIGEGAFYNCEALPSVTLPNSVTSIEDGAFSSCFALASITIPNSVTSIGEWAFYYCRSLPSVTIPNSVTSIGEHAFYGCEALTKVTIPGNVTSIELNVFTLCKALTSVTIQAGVTSIGGAFRNCTSLKSVTIPDSVTSIDVQAFYGCSSLDNVTIPASVTSIGMSAFQDCTSLTSVTILNPNCDIFSYNETLGKPGTTVISGYDGSTAEEYAKKCGHTFKSLGKAPIPTATPKPTTKPTTTPAPTPMPTFSAPTVTIAQTADGIKVSWNKITGSPRYMVYYKEGNGGWKQIGTTTATSYTRKAANLKTGVTYAFTVRCCANDKKTMLSGYKASNSLTYSAAELAAPTVKIEKASDGIKVSWNKIDGAPRYMVYYKENNGGWKQIGTTTATSYTRKAANLKSGAAYQFTVRCCANDKKTLLGPYKASNSLTYTAQLAAPTVKIAKVAGGIKVTWNKVAGAPRYMVYYKEGNGGWKKIGTTTATSYTRAAKYLKNGVTYAFTVRCCANDKKTLLGAYKASNSLKYTK